MTGSLALPWPREALAQALAVLGPGAQLEIVPAVDSTNTELMRCAREGRTAPTLLVTEAQTAGRGRLGRDWHTTDAGVGGALTFSLGLPLGLLLALSLGSATATGRSRARREAASFSPISWWPAWLATPSAASRSEVSVLPAPAQPWATGSTT